jgi:formate-dependent phosphoribosylglycinamide formyltransferase (GAR transformylase)
LAIVKDDGDYQELAASFNFRQRFIQKRKIWPKKVTEALGGAGLLN